MNTTFDSGFRLAKLLRLDWFRKALSRAGWKNGDSVIGAVSYTSVEEILSCLDSGQNALVVVGDWESLANGEPSPFLRFLRVEKVARDCGPEQTSLDAVEALHRTGSQACAV